MNYGVERAWANVMMTESQEEGEYHRHEGKAEEESDEEEAD